MKNEIKMNTKICQAFTSIFNSLLLLFLLGCVNTPTKVSDAPILSEIPWNMEQLYHCPTYRWLEKSDSINSLLFEGETYKGKPTEVFAYYGLPEKKSKLENPGKYPGIVLVHGGGGTAFKWWVEKWVEKGYAAIAIDFGGNMPVESNGEVIKKALVNHGPAHIDENSFYSINSLISDQWQFHAISAIIRAHSLLRSFDEVDAERTAITGISWGGYLTNIVAGIDQRFKAAVPVYGCGFLNEKGYWVNKGIFDKMSDAQVKKWVKLWDPSQYIGYATMPVFFLNGTNDRYYYLSPFSKTAELAKNKKIRIEVNMHHSHEDGAGPKEIGVFIDHYLKGGEPLPAIRLLELRDGFVNAKTEASTGIRSSELIYSCDTASNENRTWQKLPVEIVKNEFSIEVPDSAKLYFIQVIDNNGNMITSNVLFDF
jgi:cephalosporin-C deacetylase-like acetyl esterase